MIFQSKYIKQRLVVYVLQEQYFSLYSTCYLPCICNKLWNWLAISECFSQVHLSMKWELYFALKYKGYCDEWGGAESRGNGARPVEWMIMNDTCATHRSRVPRRSFGRNKRRSDDIGRRERTRPGFYFVFCVRGSRPWGAAAFHLSLFILLLKLLNVRRFPPPSSRTYLLRYIGAETREEGGTRCQRALAAEWDRGAEEIGQQEVAETASGCPQRWCWSKRRTGGTEDSLPCSWDEEGWLPSERERRSRRRSPVGRSLLPSARLVEEQGTGDSLPAALDWRSHRRPPGGGRGIGPSTKDVQYHRMAPRVSRSVGWGPSGSVSGNRTEIFFFFLSPLSLLCHSSSFRLLSLASSVLTPQVRRGRPDGLPPGEGGGGE